MITPDDTHTARAHMPPKALKRFDRPRTAWIDLSRSVGIVLVVFGHVQLGLIQAGLMADDAAAKWVHYALYTFHMPLFFFLAGLSVPQSLQRGSKSFLMSKLWTIVYPYVLWSLVQSGVAILLSRVVNSAPHLSQLAAIAWHPIAQFWFLYALMICHLIAVLVRAQSALILAATVGFIVFQLLPETPDLTLTLHNLPLYVAGMIFAQRAGGWPAAAKVDGENWGAIAVTWAAFVATTVLGGLASGWNTLGLASVPPCILGVIGTIKLCRKLQQRRSLWLQKIGRMSMTIYIMHILAASGMRIALVKLHVPDSPVLYLTVCTLAGVGLPAVAHMVLNRLQLLGALGLAPLRTRPA